MAPTVSVVIAAYNFEPYLARALDSVFAQDYPADAIEVIVVDDGSTDGTPELVRAYEDRVTYIRKENGGHLSTFNRGIAEATGDYIALLDGDDAWLPHKLRAQVELLEACPDLGLVHGDMRVVDGDDRVLAPSFFTEHGIEEVDGDLLGVLVRVNTVTTSALLVRASLRERFHPIPDWARVQDWWISLRVAEVAGIGCIPEPVTDYRQHGGNLNHGRASGRRARLRRAELPLRRWMLTGGVIEQLPAAEAAGALASYEAAVEECIEAFGTDRRELVTADRDAAEAELRAAREAADPDDAVRALVRALAHDPWNGAARGDLVRIGRRDGWVVDDGAAVVAAEAQVEVPRVDGARAFATLADAAELAAAPELLAAYAAAFDGDDDATLVIRVGASPADLDRLQDAVAAAGLDREGAADLLAVPASQSLASLTPRVDAVLSSALPAGPLGALPTAAADGAGALANLARGIGRSFALNICAPNWWTARSWGDLHFARALQQELHRHGHPAAIHPIEQWDRSRRPVHDVVVHLKGLTAYEPNPEQLNILWCISHPEKITRQECESYDLVLVASEAFAAELRRRVSVPVEVLDQATDPEVFFPEHDAAHERELVFVGNSRKVMRRILADLLPTDRDLAVWGGDWNGLIDNRHIVGTYLPNEEVRRAYSSAAIVLNDHWDDMRDHGFASNRLYDAVACGALVLSDRIEGLEERFGGAVVTYETREELAALVEHFLAHPEERAARGAAGRELVLAQHTFAHRVEALLAHADAALPSRV